MKKFDVIYADPPWKYNNTVSNGTAESHYSTMTFADLAAIPVADMAAKDAVLFMWHTPTHAAEALALVKAWGFKFKNMNAFTWCKLNKNVTSRMSLKLGQFRARAGQAQSESMAGMTRDNMADAEELLNMVIAEAFMGMGNYTRSNAECCLVATRGKALERASKSVKQLILEPLADHSSKPEEAARRIETIYPHHSKIELFARRPREGWSIFGDEPDVPYDVKLIDADGIQSFIKTGD